MKKLFLLTIISIIPFLAKAQSKYTAGFEVGSLFQISKPVNLNYTLKDDWPIVMLEKGITTLVNANFVNGFNLNDRIFVGAGIGVEYSTWETMEKVLSWYLTEYDAINMPLFARFKVDFITTQVTPFFQIDLGYNALLSSVYIAEYKGRSYKRSGILFAPAFGIDIKFNEKQKLYINLQYLLQAQGENDYYTSNSIHSFGVKLGMLF